MRKCRNMYLADGVLKIKYVKKTNFDNVPFKNWSNHWTFQEWQKSPIVVVLPSKLLGVISCFSMISKCLIKAIKKKHVKSCLENKSTKDAISFRLIHRHLWLFKVLFYLISSTEIIPSLCSKTCICSATEWPLSASCFQFCNLLATCYCSAWLKS